MVRAAAIYHDLGLGVDRETHHLHSGSIVRKDPYLKRKFSPEQVEMIAQAVEDHRASSTNKPRSTLGAIIADADNMDGQDAPGMFRRALSYNPNRSFDDLYEHLSAKYGKGGYASYVLPESTQRMKSIQEETQRILADKEASRNLFLKLQKRA